MSEAPLRSMRIVAAAVFLLTTALVPSRAGAQSIWDQIKAEAAKRQQQKQQTPAKKPGEQPATPASQPPAENATASGDFGTPEGTATIASSLAYVDIVGIKLGMPMQDAIDAAMVDNKGFKQTVLAQSCISLTSPCSNSAAPHETVGVSAVAGNESIFVSFTPPPTPQVVFSVKRQLKIPATNVDALVASLQKKYGPESLNSDTAGNPLGSSAGIKSYVWLFDLQGHLAAGDQAVPFVGCADLANVMANGAGSLGTESAAVSFDPQSQATIASSSNHDPYPYPGSNPCVAVTAVTAVIQVNSKGMANNLAVEIGSYPLLHSALRASWADFDQQFKMLAAAAPARGPIPMPEGSSPTTSAQPAGRPPIPTPGGSAQPTGRLPVPVSQPTALADDSGAPAAFDPAKLPDVIGIHLGMNVDDAKTILQEHYPTLPITGDGATGIAVKGGAASDSVSVDITEAPDTPQVWHVGRVAVHQHVDRGTLITALRQKYGVEAFHGHAGFSAQPVTDTQIQVMEWVFDEQGNPVSGVKLVNGAVGGCVMGGAAREGANLVGVKFYESAPTTGAQAVKGACASLVLVGVQLLESSDIIETFYTSAADLALVRRESKATYAFKQAQAVQKQKQDDEKAKLTKPTL